MSILRIGRYATLAADRYLNLIANMSRCGDAGAKRPCKTVVRGDFYDGHVMAGSWSFRGHIVANVIFDRKSTG